MTWNIFYIFLLLFGLYIIFGRQPDFFDSQTTTAIVSLSEDKQQLWAKFSLNGTDTIAYNPSYIGRDIKVGDVLPTIYASNNPKNATVYAIWGYWISWKELIACIIGYVLLYQIALAITRNPSQEAMKELEEEAKKVKIRKPRYDV